MSNLASFRDSTPTLRLLSLGAGVQSTAVLLLACDGVIPRFDYALFADTRWERRAMYANRGQYFLHRSCTPLDEVNLEPPTTTRRHLHLVVADGEEEADPDGSSPWTCRSGTAVTEDAA